MPPWTTSSMWPWQLGIVLLLVAAVPMRLHSLDRSLWLDETWVANSVLEPDLVSVFHYEAWLQTTPPVFLVLERLIVDALPVSNETFRLLPCFFGLFGIGAMALVTRQFLRPATAFIVLLLFVFAPGHVLYSQTLKQYTSDVSVSIVLMGLGLSYLRHRTNRLLLISIIVFIAVAGLSYNAVLFMSAFLYGALFEPPDPSRRLPAWHVRWTRVGAVIGAVAVSASVNYFWFIKPNLDGNILSDGTEGAAPGEFASLLLKALQVLHVFRHFFFSLGSGWGGVWLSALMAGAAFVAFLGLLHLCLRGGRGQPRNLDKAAVLALPIAGALVLAVIGYYPLNVARLNLFLLPAALILFGFGLQALVLYGRFLARRRVTRRSSWLRSRPYAAVCIGLAALFVLRVEIASTAPFFSWDEPDDENSQAAVAYLADVATPGDVLYVGATMIEPVKLYERFTPIDGPRLVRGNVGWPCCPRDVALDRPARPERTLPPEIDRIFDGGVDGTLWTLHTDRPRWHFVGADYPDLLDARLRERGCHPADTPDFAGVRLNRYRCSGTAGS